MKNKLLIFFTLILSACYGTKDLYETKTFAGTWFLNKSGDTYDGKMVISDCNDKQCKFKTYSSQYGHTCNTDGIIKIKETDTAEYYLPYFDASVIFVLESNNTMNVYYGNTNSWNVFCGMNATIEGNWTRF